MIPENEELNDFWEMNKFEHVVLEPICLKDLFPSTSDLILIDHKQSLLKTHVFESGISDHRTTIFSVLRNFFAKTKAKTVF